jgi:chloramphenicol O-acetyltransferase type B
VSSRIIKSYANLLIHQFKRKKFKFSFFTVTDFYSQFGDYVNLGGADIRCSKIGDFSYVSKKTAIARTEIGKFCSIGPRCLIGGLGKHPIDFISTHPIFYSPLKQASISFASEQYFEEFTETYIGNDVWIGANCTILDGVTIGDGAIVAAGALVNKDVEPYSIVGGVPAKLIRSRFSEKEIQHLINICWWNWSLEALKNNVDIFRKNQPFNLASDLKTPKNI